MLYSLSNIPEDKLVEIQSIEAEIGQPLLAFTEVKAEPARLDRENSRKFVNLKITLALFWSR